MNDRRQGFHSEARAGREADVMAASNGPILATKLPAPARGPLRIRMTKRPGRDHLDGGWWPQSRDLAIELADLVDHLPARFGRIVRTVVSPSDWDPAPRRISVARGYVKVGSFHRDDTHVIRLKTSDRVVLRVLVVPPGFTDDQGDEALLAAATPGNTRTGADLLDTVTEHPDVDPEDLWNDDGGTWWGPDSVAPSFRGGG
jgi:hypothetical protein